MTMKRLFLLLALTPVLHLWADDTTLIDSVYIDSTAIVAEQEVRLIIDEMPNVAVHQDSAITNLMIDKTIGFQRGVQEVDGFRVQVYASNLPQVAKNEALLLQQELAPRVDVEIYVISEPPFWKVRLGNFKTREEATEYKEMLNMLFPDLRGGTYVVQDKVIIKQ